MKNFSEFFDELEIVLLKLHGIFSPETFSVDRAPLQDIMIDFFLILVKIAEDLNVVLENCASVTDLLQKLLVFDVTFQQSVNDLEQL